VSVAVEELLLLFEDCDHICSGIIRREKKIVNFFACATNDCSIKKHKRGEIFKLICLCTIRYFSRDCCLFKTLRSHLTKCQVTHSTMPYRKKLDVQEDWELVTVVEEYHTSSLVEALNIIEKRVIFQSAKPSKHH